jgi:aminomethyltransferase
MPEAFSDTREEHLATRRAAGLFDFTFMALWEFVDGNAIAELQRLQTRNLASLEPGRLAYTLLLHDDGSVFNDATVWRLADGRFWLFTGRRSDTTWIRRRAAATDRSGEHAVFALQGPASGAILARLLGSEAVRDLKYFHFAITGEMLAARLGYSGELGYELIVPLAAGPKLRQMLIDAGRGHGMRECGFAAADSLRIESGYVLFGREIDGRANPRELGLARLVSAQQARYPLARKLVGLEILDRPARADLPLARATSECDSPLLDRRIALGFADAADTASGTQVTLENGKLARVARLPFYDPGRRLPRARPL